MKIKFTLSLYLALVIFISGCNPSKSLSVSVAEPTYWRTTNWQITSPEAQGMDSTILARMLEKLDGNLTRFHSILIIRNGYIVTEAYFHPYTRDTKIQTQSI